MWLGPARSLPQHAAAWALVHTSETHQGQIKVRGVVPCSRQVSGREENCNEASSCPVKRCSQALHGPMEVCKFRGGRGKLCATGCANHYRAQQSLSFPERACTPPRDHATLAGHSPYGSRGVQNSAATLESPIPLPPSTKHDRAGAYLQQLCRRGMSVSGQIRQLSRCVRALATSAPTQLLRRSSGREKTEREETKGHQLRVGMLAGGTSYTLCRRPSTCPGARTHLLGDGGLGGVVLCVQFRLLRGLLAADHRGHLLAGGLRALSCACVFVCRPALHLLRILRLVLARTVPLACTCMRPDWPPANPP